MITVAIISNDDEVLSEYFIDLELGNTAQGKPFYQADCQKVPFIKAAFDTLPFLKPRRLGLHNGDD